ncbi:MAG TPA: adenosylcobinamide-GDP ribazoletransferase [Acidimicrobiia bacterium]|nr:adenosylcobinamide-GDP ribazoletransferase [Acidimicrobiia bacterium]
MLEALGFLTVLGRPAPPTPRSLPWFPVVGAAIGAAVGSVWWLAVQAFPALLAAALAVTADLAITGLLHADGLADAADGLLPHADRARRLEIMRSPGVGAFGAAALIVVLVTRTAGLAARPADIALLAGLWCASRTLAAAAPAWLPYAREDGLASPFLTRPASRLLALAVLPATALTVLGVGWPGVAVIAAALVAGASVLAIGHHRVGGFTGDVLGAAILVAETAGLVVAGARW